MARIVKNPEERRKEILIAARDLFLTKDYHRTTMKDVMEKVGIAKGTVYHYFRSKEELLEAVIDDIAAELLDTMQEVVDKAEGSALEKMQFLMESGKLPTEQQAVIDYLHRPGNEALHVRLMAVNLSKQAPIYAKLIQEGCQEGIFQTESPLECAEFILAGVQFLMDQGVHPWTKDELTRRIHAFPKLIEKILSAPSDAFAFIPSLLVT